MPKTVTVTIQTTAAIARQLQRIDLRRAADDRRRRPLSPGGWGYARDIAQRNGMKPRGVSMRLTTLGLQYRDADGRYRPTAKAIELGLAHAEACPTAGINWRVPAVIAYLAASTKGAADVKA